MQRKDREMPPSFAYDVVDKCAWAVLSMADEEGKPYCVPVSIARERNEIYFHSAKFGKNWILSEKMQMYVYAVSGRFSRFKVSLL